MGYRYQLLFTKMRHHPACAAAALRAPAQVEDVTDDCGVVKKTLVASSEWRTPNEGSTVTLRLKGMLQTMAVFDEHPEGQELVFVTDEGACVRVWHVCACVWHVCAAVRGCCVPLCPTMLLLPLPVAQSSSARALSWRLPR